MSDSVETLAAPAPEPEERMGPIGRARASLTAIEALLRLREDQTTPTEDDLAALRHWPGWGPLAPALSDTREGTWAEIGERLQELLSTREYRQAEQGTPTAYYTPDRIVDAGWTALRDLGFRGGRLFEPGCGAGAFIGRTPAGMDAEWFGVERDPTTAGIAALLHPDAQIVNARLQDAAVQSNSVDAVLGNVPYGNFPVFDKTAPKQVTDSIHNYFIWRSVQALRPGGIAILLTSRYTMDSADEDARRAIAKHADLLGAIRLPNGALAEGGTGVLADILVLRRRDTDGPMDESWMGVSEISDVPGQYANDYFLTHPERVLGTFEQGRAAQYGHTLAVKAPEGQDLTAALAGAFDGITAAARAEGREWRVAVGAQPFTEDTLPFPVREDGRKEGSFHLVDNVPHEVIDGELVAVARAGKELPKLIALRDATLRLIEAETDYDRPDEQLEPLRADVNFLYDRYVRAHGPINRYTKVEGEVDEETGEPSISRRYPRLGGFRRDPDFVAVLALEDFDDETQVARKAALLTRRVNRRIERPTSAATPEEALSLALNFTNKVDTAVIASLLNIEEDQVPSVLGDLVYREPDTGELLTPGEYLSGPVMDKLERAEFLLSQGRGDLQRHVDALREVQPEPLAPEDIKAKLGAPWIPPEDVAAFAEELLGVQVDITHIARTATWSVDLPMTMPEAATSEWGTSRVNAFELLDLALNGQAPKVYDTFKTPEGGTRRVRNDKETMLAETKLTDLSRRFASWVWEDPDRAERLAADYNRIFNSTVLRKHNGSHLTVDGLDPEFHPYEHQWDFVQRVLSAEEGSLCPYPVGAGKTATMFMTALKLKQLGLVAKPMVVVPNHLLEQIARDGKKLFPNAQILMAGKKDLADARARMLFAARVATGDWDTIVMTHSSFGRLGVHPITEATYLEELANEYRQALGVVDAEDNPRRIKEIAKMVDRFDARASDLRSKAVDAGVSYENLGVDFLQVDEAHLFKNLALPAVTEGMVLGKPSKRATDLDLKIITTRERTGRDNVVALYSGTFISNSVREMYVFEHYTMPKRLEKLGLGTADAWAANHINFESRPEIGVDGVSFRLKRRPVDYVNADEALAVFQEVAELRPREAFKIERPKRVDRFVEIEATPNLVSYVAGISDRIDMIQSGKVEPWEDNMLKVITDGRKAALDLELVGVEPDGPGKSWTIARNVLEVYHRTKDLEFPNGITGGLQLVFCDLGTPSKKKGSQVYGKIRRYLIDGMPGEGIGGIPRERIKFIHDYNGDLAKEQLFSDARAGKVSVLFMSSEKGGTGVNVQPLAVALHHADPPHKPAEWEQREGRVDRPGNLMIKLGLEVEFYRYLALNSFDSYMFQQLERKQRPIVQIMSGRKVGRVIQEIDPVGASFGQAKAIVAGNPLLMDLADANGELTVLLNAADGHRQAQGRMRRKVDVLSDQIREAERALPAMQAMAAAVTADETWRTADGRLVDADDVPGTLARAAQGSKPTLDLTTGYAWRGVAVGFTFHRRQQFRSVEYESWAHLVAGGRQADVRLNLAWFGKGQAWRIVKALGEAADEAVLAPGEVQRQLDKWRATLEDTRSHLGRPFEKRAELEAVRERKAALEAAIADSAVSSGRESQAGPQFDPGAAGDEMSLTDMALHDATTTAEMLGGTAVVVSEGESIGGARLTDSSTLPERDYADLTDPRVQDDTLHALIEVPDPAQMPAENGAAPPPTEADRLTDPQLWEEGLGTLTEGAAGVERLVRAARVNDLINFGLAVSEWAEDWMLDRYGPDATTWPRWAQLYFDSGDQAYEDREQLHQAAARALYPQMRAVDTTTEPQAPPVEEAASEAAGEADRLHDLIDGLGDRVMVGHIGPSATPTPAAGPAASGPAEESEPQPLPESATPVPGAEGYHYTEESRTVRLYTDSGDQVGTAKWSYTKYRYLGDVHGDTVRGTEDAATIAKRMAHHHAVVYGDQVHRPPLDDQGHDPVWILHSTSDTLVFGIQPEDDTARAALWTAGGFKQSRKVGGWYLPRTWKVPTRKERVDTAVRVLAAAGRTVPVYASRNARQRAERPARLPELAVTAPDVEQTPQLFAAPPFVDDADMAAAVERLDGAHERWSQHPTVAAYTAQDYEARPNGFGRPDNPIAELRFAYLYASAGLRNGPVPGGADEVVRRVHAVAAWCQALEPVVDADLLDPLQEVYEAAHLLAARSQATVAALIAEQSAAEETPAPAAAEAAAATEQPQPDTGEHLPAPAAAEPAEEETSAPAAEQPEAPSAADTVGDSQPVEPAPMPDTAEASEPEPAPGPVAPDPLGVPAGPAVPAESTAAPVAGAPGAESPATADGPERDTTVRTVEEGQLDLFGEVAPAPAPAARRRGQDGPEPAVPPGTGDGPRGGRVGVYGPADAATAQDGQIPMPGPASGDPAPAELAAPVEPTAASATDTMTQDAPEADIEEPEPTTTDRGDMATPPSTADTDDPDTDGAMPVEGPPEPQPFTDITPLTAGPAYELHLTGLDGQVPTAGELWHGGVAIAVVRMTADGRWFARMAVDGMPADITALNNSPQDAAHQGAILFAVLTTTPYGEQPGAAAADGSLSRADRFRVDLRDVARGHLEEITLAAAQARADYAQIPQFQELRTRLVDLSAAAAEGHGSRQMAANLTAVQDAVNAWGQALPTDAALDERQFLAWPLAHLLYDTGRLHGRLQATLDAVQAERAALAGQQATAAPAVPAELAPDAASVRRPPETVAEPVRERVRGPVVTVGLRSAGGAGVAAHVETGGVAHTVVLAGVTTGDLRGQLLPAAAELPALVRPAGRAEQLLGDEETERWLAGHLDRGPLAPAWNTAAARAALVVVVRDALRDQAAPSVDDIADWLVETATEHDGLLLAAHTADSVEAFAPAFARAADAQVTADGSEYLMWRYFWTDGGAQRDAALARAVERAYDRLLAEEPPAAVSVPEQAAAPQPTEPAVPRPDALEDSEMATPARPAAPESQVAADPAPAEPAGELPLWVGPDSTDAAEPAEDRPADVVADFAAVQEAWDEHVPASQGTGADLFASVEEQLVRLETLLAETVAQRTPAPEPPAAQPAPAPGPRPAAEVQPPPAPAEPEAPQTDANPQQRASAVNTALREADAHAPALQDLPEWQRIQTVRGAFSNLVRVIRERAGEHLDKLLDDGRLGDWLRRTSIRVCETIAKWAQSAADRLRKGGERNADDRGALPSAEALLRLGDAALEYRGPRRGPGGDGTGPASPAVGGASTVVDVPAMRAMGEALSRPMPGAAKRVSTAAARGRSTTAKRTAKKTAAGGASGVEQAGHLRRTGTEQPQARKPTQR